MLTRREFGTMAIAGLAFPRIASAFDSIVNGVHIGVQTYSYRDLARPAGAADSVDVVIDAMKTSGLTECELFSPQLEPQFGSGARGARGAPPSADAIKAREDLRRWRLETPLDHFRNARRKFDAAGITITAYCYNMNASFTDAELERGFEMTKALGAPVMTTSTQMEVAKRLAPLADKHTLVVGLHGHSNVSDPNEFATPESFAAAMTMSKYLKVNLDVGHFVSADYDPVAYIREHHADITNLHLKDRKKHQGDNTPWGQGDTPIKEVLQLLKQERWAIPVDIEYEYRGTGTSPEEVKKCYEYAKQALA
ncbi:MAG: Xylose isomerase [Acidobacteria bacterium]|nr:Xylose isomerase [Acidobacteriota bacterium]